MIVRAYAKINLTLHVLGRRNDGYHDIESVMQTISIHDTLDIELTETGEIDLKVEMIRPEQAPVAPDETNLCHRASRLFLDAVGSKKGVKIKLRKLTPSQAGLGGGSSDAAATLNALNKLHGNPLGMSELTGVARRLGADVPFFLTGGTGRIRGIGEVVEEIEEIDPIRMLVLKPDCNVSTPDAYKAIDQARERDGWDASAERISENDFEAVIYPAYPKIAETRDFLRSIGCDSTLLCGSGSAVAGFFLGEDTQTKERMQKSYRTALTAIESGEIAGQVFPCRTVTRAQIASNKAQDEEIQI